MISLELAPTADAREQLLDAQIVGADAFERREHAVQHVIAAAKAAGALDRVEIGRRRDDARPAPDRAARRSRARTDRCSVRFMHVEQRRILLFDLDERLRQIARVLAGRAQDVEGEARGGLLADAGQLGELADQP